MKNLLFKVIPFALVATAGYSQTQLETHLDHALKDAQELTKTAQTAQADLAKAQKEIAELKKQNQSYGDEVKTLKSKSARSKKEAAEFEQLRRQNEALTNHNESLKQKLSKANEFFKSFNSDAVEAQDNAQEAVKSTEDSSVEK
ncbi:MAG: hypothetical protein V4534_01955 [Myxococcota bacterium]